MSTNGTPLPSTSRGGVLKGAAGEIGTKEKLFIICSFLIIIIGIVLAVVLTRKKQPTPEENKDVTPSPSTPTVVAVPSPSTPTVVTVPSPSTPTVVTSNTAPYSKTSSLSTITTTPTAAASSTTTPAITTTPTTAAASSTTTPAITTTPTAAASAPVPYVRIPNYDLGGNDLPPYGQVANDPSECNKRCDSTSGCKGAVFVPSNKQCWMKNKIDGMYYMGDREFNIKPQTGSYTKLTNMDRGGYDLPPYGAVVNNASECTAKCDATAECKAAVFIPSNKQCWMKSRTRGMYRMNDREMYIKNSGIKAPSSTDPFSLLNNKVGKCVHPKDSNGSTNNTPLVLWDGCVEDRLDFEMTPAGSLKHKLSGKCVHPAGGTGVKDAELVLHDGCDEDRLKFEITPAGAIKHTQSGLCAHNQFMGEGNGTKLVLYPGCEDASNRLYYSKV